MSYKSIVLDLDGTLTNARKEITPRTKAAILRAQQQGIKVILASGRPVAGIEPLAKELELDTYGGYILAFNGGKVIDYKSGEIIYESALPVHIITELYKTARENQVAILSYSDKAVITESPEDPHVIIEAELNKMPIHSTDCFTRTICSPVPKCLMVGEEAHIAALESIVQTRFGKNVNVFRSEPFFLEIMPPNIDKAYSLKRLLNRIGIDRKQAIACGDGFNDLSMIQFAGLGVAMANAQPIVREAADYITLSNEEDGIAHVIDTFILNPN